MPEMLLRKAVGAVNWPSGAKVGYSVRRTDTFSAISFCLAGSVSLEKASRSFSISASHGQPKVALSHEALMKAADTGFITSGEPHEVKKALQPPDASGSFLARRATRVCQSIACRSTLKPAASSCGLA